MDSKNKIWLHRISYEACASYPLLLTKGYLSIGWSDLCNTEFLASIADGVDIQKKIVPAIKKHYGNVPRSNISLKHFLCDISVGDWVLVPVVKAFHILEVKGKPVPISQLPFSDFSTPGGSVTKSHDDGRFHIHDGTTGKIIDLGFAINVEFIERDIPRKEYADRALTARMKIRQTTADITDLKESINKAIECYKQKKPLNIYSDIVNNTSKIILETIKNISNPNKLEEIVKWYFERINANTVDIPAKNSPHKVGDADVVATFEAINTIIYVQVKHHNNVENTWAIQQIQAYKEQKDSVDDGYSKIGWVISLADRYNEDAINLAKENGIILVNGLEFAEMLLNVGIANLDMAGI